MIQLNEIKRMQQLAGIITESQLNEEEINFKDADQYADFLQNKTKELENSKIKLKIYDTFSNEDPEKEKFSGYVTANILKRTGGTGNLIFDATLIDNGGYKLLAPLKGKKISLTIPSTTGGNGGFKSEDPQMGGLFKVETFEFLDKPQAAPQAESIDPLDEIINNALKSAGIVNESQLSEAENITPDQAIQKAIPLASKIENSPELDKVAAQIAKNPSMMAQLEKALAQGGVQANLNEAEEELDQNDMKTLMLNFAKKTNQVQERISNDGDADTSSAGLGMAAAVIGGTVGSSVSGLIAAAIPAVTSIVAGPAVFGALIGIALFMIARKIYLINNPDA